MKFTDNVTWTQFTFVIGIMMALFGILFNMISNTNKELSVYNDKFYGQIWQQDLGNTTAASLNATNSAMFPIRYQDAGALSYILPATRFPFDWNSSTNIPNYITTTGTRTPVTDKNFFVYYVYAVQDSRNGKAIKIVSAPSQFISLTNAQAHSWADITASYTTFSEQIRPLYKLIFEYRASYDVGAKYSILRQVDDIRKAFIQQLTNTSGSLPASSITVVPAGNISSTNVQSTLEELDTEKAPLASPTFTGTPVAPTAAVGDSTTQIATTEFVQTAVRSVPGKAASDYATTTALPTVVYNNGTSGVGATLTAVAVGAISIDGSSPSVNDRILVKNQASTFQNGIYTVTATGSGVAVFVLTRALDFNQSQDIKTGASTYVVGGSTLAATTWDVNSADDPVMGTDAITFVQSAGPGSFIAGTGISISGNTISTDSTVYRTGGTDVAITDGGTGASTATSAFDNLSPLTSQGDIMYYDGTHNVRLPKGNLGQTLTMTATIPSWQNASGATSFTKSFTASSAVTAGKAAFLFPNGNVTNSLTATYQSPISFTRSGVQSIHISGDNFLIVGYQTSSPYTLYAQIVNRKSNTYGTEVTLGNMPSFSTQYFELTQLSDTTAVVSWASTTTQISSRILTISDTTITLGSEYTQSMGSNIIVDLWKMYPTASGFMLMGMVNISGNYGAFTIATSVSGSTITYGSIGYSNSISGQNVGSYFTYKFSDSQFGTIFFNSSLGYWYGLAIFVSGSTASIQLSMTQLHTGNDSSWGAFLTPSPDSTYLNSGYSGYLYSVFFSGTSMSYNSNTSYTAYAMYSSISINGGFIVYSVNSGTYYLHKFNNSLSLVNTYSSTTNPGYPVYTNSAIYSARWNSTTNELEINYFNSSLSKISTSKYAFLGLTLAETYTVSYSGNQYIRTLPSADGFYFLPGNSNTPSSNTVVFKIAGTKAFSYSTASATSDNFTDNNYIVRRYVSNNDITMLSSSLTQLRDFPTNNIGITTATVAANASVDVVMRGVASTSGLLTGMDYYAGTDGTLSTTTSSVKVGIALSSTELLV